MRATGSFSPESKAMRVRRAGGRSKPVADHGTTLKRSNGACRERSLGISNPGGRSGDRQANPRPGMREKPYSRRGSPGFAEFEIR
jgi:hypothetical protein